MATKENSKLDLFVLGGKFRNEKEKVQNGHVCYKCSSDFELNLLIS